MHYFFSTLQQRKSVRNDFPVILIDVLIQKMDEMIHSSVLQQHYAGKEQQLFKDVLQLFCMDSLINMPPNKNIISTYHISKLFD